MYDKSGMWTLFTKTGNLDIYLKYKQIKEDDKWQAKQLKQRQ